MITMHEYPNGMTGLAAFCDVCGEQVTKNGYVIWDGDNPKDWLVVHQARCDPGYPGSPLREQYDCSMDLDVEIVYLANSVHANLDRARGRVSVFASLES